MTTGKETGCSICDEDEVCPGKHCLVELAHVVEYVRGLGLKNTAEIADRIHGRFDWPPTELPGTATEPK